jgi:acyl dehydratase
MVAIRWYEDFDVGETFVSPGKTMTESEIVDWAFRFDPQPFHMDKEAARDHMYGGLIASGWMLTTHAFRLFMAVNPFDGSSLGSPGCDALRWLVPVRPGDTIRTIARITGMRTSRSKPDRGLIDLNWEVRNQHDETVMRMTSVQRVARRPDGAGTETG